MKSFKDLNIKPEFPLHGIKESILLVKNKPIIIQDFRFLQIEEDNKLLDTTQIQFCYENDLTNRITFTRSKVVRKQLQDISKDHLPISATFKEKDRCLYLD